MPEDIYTGDMYEEPVGGLSAAYSAPSWATQTYTAPVVEQPQTINTTLQSLNKGTRDYIKQVQDLAKSKNPALGSFYSGIPLVDYLVEDYANGYRRSPVFATEEDLSGYLTKTPEENLRYQASLQTNKDKLAGTLDIAGDTPVVLVDNTTGKIVAQGVGFDAAQQIAKQAGELSSSMGNKASWSVYTGAPGATDLSQFKQVATDTPDKSLLGTIADIALPALGAIFLPGIGAGLGLGGLTTASGAATALGAGLGAATGSGLSGTLQGKDIGDILKSAAFSGATAGLVNAPILPGGGTISSAVGKGLQGLGSAGGQVAGQAIVDPLANEIVVTGLNKGLQAAGQGLAQTALSSLPSVFKNPITGELSVNQYTQPKLAEPAGGLDALPAEDIVVTAGKTPLDLSGAAGGSLGAFVPQVVTNPITGETTVQRTETPQEKPVEEKFDETFAQPNDIVVTAGPDLSALNNLVSGGLSSLTPSVSTPMTPPAEGPLSQEEVTQETTPTENEIVVEGDTGLNLPPLPLPPITSVDIPDLAGTVLPDVPQGPLSQETAQKEEPTNEIVVEGNTAKPIEDLLSSVGAAVPPLNTVDIPADAGNVTPKEDKGGLSTLDKLRLAGAVLGGLGGGVGGTGGGATIPSGFGRRDPIYSAKLPTPGQNGAFAVGGLGGGTLPMPAGGDLTQFGMGNATRAAPTQIPQYGGVNPPGFNTQTWDWLGPQQTVAKDIMDQLAVLPSSAAPVAAPAAEPVEKAMGGYAVGGPGDGRSDEIPALLSDGEYVIDAETVALLGNGSSKAGARQLDKFRANIRKHKGRQLARGKFSVKAKQPDAYLSGGR